MSNESKIYLPNQEDFLNFHNSLLTETHPRVRKESEIYEPWLIRLIDQAEFNALNPDGKTSSRQLAFLSSLALLAPTSHNTISERFRFNPEDNSIEVWTDRQYVLPESDKYGPGRQDKVGLGCVIEQAIIAGEAYGWGAVVLPMTGERPIGPLQSSENRYAPIAKIQFVPGAVEPRGQEYLKLMLDRSVFRNKFDESIVLTPETIELMKNFITEKYPYLRLDLITDQELKRAIASNQRFADGVVVNIGSFARELGEWLKANPNSTEARGMRGEEFGLGDVASEEFSEGLKGNRVLRAEQVQGFASMGFQNMLQTAAIAILSVRKDVITEQVAVGRAYMDLVYFLDSENGALGVDMLAYNRIKRQHGGELNTMPAEAIVRGQFKTGILAAQPEVDQANLFLRSRLWEMEQSSGISKSGKLEKGNSIIQDMKKGYGLKDLIKLYKVTDIFAVLGMGNSQMISERPTMLFRIGRFLDPEDSKRHVSGRVKLPEVMLPNEVEA